MHFSLSNLYFAYFQCPDVKTHTKMFVALYFLVYGVVVIVCIDPY